MASSLRVTLELDDRGYITRIQRAEQATKQFANTAEKDVTAASGAFGKLNSATDFAVKKFGGLRTVLAGLTFGALGRSALQMADGIQDLSNATGIAVGRLLEFKNALATSGGEAEAMPNAINQFVRSIDEANQGSIKAQNSFMDLKVSMEDLRKLSEQDLLLKTLDGIAAIEDPSRRASLMMDKFGKSFKSVDPGEMAAKLRESAGSMDQYAASVMRAAKLNDDLVTAQSKLKLAVLEAFSPLITKVNEFSDATGQGTEKMNALITAIKIAGATLVAAFAIPVLLQTVGLFGTLGRSLGTVASAVGATGLSAWLASAFRVLGPLLSGFRALAILIGAGLGIYTASQLFDDFGSIAVNALARVTEGIGRMIGELLNIPTDAIGALMGIKNPIGFGSAFIMAADNAQKTREEIEKAARYAKQVGGGRGDAQGAGLRVQAGEGVAVATGSGVIGTMSMAGGGRDQDTTARRNAIQSIKDISLEYEKQQKLRLGILQTETFLVGKTEEEKQLYQAQTELALAYQQTQEQLIQKRNGLSKDEQYLAGEINAAIKRNSEIYGKQSEDLAKTVTANQTALAVERDRKAVLDSIVKSIEDQISRQQTLDGIIQGQFSQRQDMNFERSIKNLSEYSQQMNRIQEEGRKTTIALQNSFGAGFTEEDMMNPTRAKEFADGIAKIAKNQQQLTTDKLADLEASRTWSYGWDEAFRSYAENANNAATQAKTFADTFKSGFEDAFVSFVKTGKLSFRSLIDTMLIEFARFQAKKMFGDLFGGGGMFSSIGSLFGGFFADGGTLGAGKFGIVGERGPELISGPATITPMTAGGSVVNQYITNNINAVDSRSVAQLFYEHRQTLFGTVEQAKKEMPFRGAMA
jgi:hypothetical protein